MTKRPANSTQQKANTSAAAAHLGIFWLLDGKLITDTTPLTQAEPYGDHRTHARGHAEVWEQWQQIGKVPADVPYEEPPRGRVMCNTKTREFVLLADRCILDKKTIVAEIRKALCLPKKVTLGTDPHYRCHKCLYGSDTDDDWGE